MSKITLQSIASLENTTAINQINSNFATIQAALDNTLSRDGTLPNQIGAAVDMNSHPLINLPAPVGATEPVRLTDMVNFGVGGTFTPLPVGGSTGQVLEKVSSSNYDVAWTSLPAPPDLTPYAPLASPALTGTPTAPTAALGTNTTQLATTAFVLANASTASLKPAATRTVLKAFDTTVVNAAVLEEDGREGVFVWKTGDYSTFITNDPQEGVYIKANAIASTSGAWVRVRTEGVYNVKWFGAKGDNTTDDNSVSNPAIQSAINLANFLAGGTILFPKGGYLISVGLTLNTALVKLEGVGKRYTSITSTATNISLITISAARCGVENLSIFNLVVPSTANGLVKLASGAVQVTLTDLDLVGGWYCIYSTGGFNCLINDCVARLAWGGAAVYTVNSGALIFENCVLDQDWAGGVPALNGSNDKTTQAGGSGRVNSTAYNLKDFVDYSGVILQCVQAGTTAASAPGITNIWYGTQITDGTVKWQIAGNAAGCAAQVDSNCSYITFKDTDMTGSYKFGAQVTNGLGTTAPDVIRFQNVTIGGTFVHGIDCEAGKSIWITGCEIQSCVGINSFRSAIVLNNGLTGEQIIQTNRLTGFTRGVFDNHSVGSVLYTGNTILGMSTSGIDVQANRNDFVIVGNNLGGSAVWGNNTYPVSVQTGTSTNYIITNNRTHGATNPISDGGSGTKYVPAGSNI